MGILTQFQDFNGQEDLEIEMPYPVRVGDEIEVYATGYNWTVESVTWIITQADENNNQTVELLVRGK